MKNSHRLPDYYRMSSEAFSAAIRVSPERLRAAAEVHGDAAAEYQRYVALCRGWLGEVEAEILRCHGAVAAPVGAALTEFAGKVGDQGETAAGRHGAVSGRLTTAAAGYVHTDEAGAAAIRGV